MAAAADAAAPSESPKPAYVLVADPFAAKMQKVRGCAAQSELCSFTCLIVTLLQEQTSREVQDRTHRSDTLAEGNDTSALSPPRAARLKRRG